MNKSRFFFKDKMKSSSCTARIETQILGRWQNKEVHHILRVSEFVSPSVCMCEWKYGGGSVRPHRQYHMKGFRSAFCFHWFDLDKYAINVVWSIDGTKTHRLAEMVLLTDLDGKTQPKFLICYPLLFLTKENHFWTVCLILWCLSRYEQ